jgi:outer membrane protein
MKNVLNLLSVLTVIAFMALGTTANAQKIAYVDSDKIVPEMPAYKRAKSEVEAYGKQLQKVLEGKQKDAQAYYQEIMEKAEKGELTPKQEQEAQAKLQKMQEDLQKEAADADRKLAAKEGELTEPLYKEYKTALEKVAKENQYNYILDKKMLLYSDGGIDATEKIKTALGISW